MVAIVHGWQHLIQESDRSLVVVMVSVVVDVDPIILSNTKVDRATPESQDQCRMVPDTERGFDAVFLADLLDVRCQLFLFLLAHICHEYSSSIG